MADKRLRHRVLGTSYSSAKEDRSEAAAVDVEAVTEALAGTYVGPMVDLAAKGADLTGVAGGRTAFLAGLTDVAGGGGLFVPKGTLLLDTSVTTLTPSHLHIKGEGMWLSTIKAGFVGAMFNGDSSFATALEELVLEDICIDLAGLATVGFAFNANTTLRRMVCHNVRFTNLKTAADAIRINSGVLYLTGDTLFHNPAEHAGKGRAVLAGVGARVHWENTVESHWLGQDFATTAGLEANVDQDITEAHYLGGYHDQYWPYIPAQLSGEGGTVTYTATGLADTGADFSAVAAAAYPNITPLRAMPVRRTGTTTTASDMQLIDTAATFIASGVIRGDIVRASDRWAIVESVQSETVLNVFKWFDNTTLRPVLRPALGTAYTVYGFIYGYATAKTTTTLTVTYWTNWFGTRVTPAAGTRYEVMQVRPAQILAPGHGCRSIVIPHGARYFRGWADMAGTMSAKSVIRGHFKDGQDMGITIAGADCDIDALIEHCGAGSVWADGDNCSIGGKHIGNGWNFDNAAEPLTPITVRNSSRCMVKPGTLIKKTAEGTQAVTAVKFSGTGTGNQVLDIINDGHTNDLDVVSRTMSGSRIRGVAPVVISSAGTGNAVINLNATYVGTVTLRTVDVKDYAATPAQRAVCGDGFTKPLSTYYASLALAQVDYPHVTATSNSLDWAILQKAINTGQHVRCPAGTYRCNQPLKLITTGQRLMGVGSAFSAIINFNTDVLLWSDTALVDTSHISDITLESGVGGGNVIVVGSALSNGSLSGVKLRQLNPAKHVWFEDNVAGCYRMVFEKSTMFCVANGTVSPWYVRAAGNFHNTNTYRDLWVDTTTTLPFFRFESTAASGPFSALTFRDINAERCDGGIITLLSCDGTTIDHVVGYDNATVAADLITIGAGSGGRNSRKTTIINFDRRAGTLNSGVKDIKVTNASDTTLINCGGRGVGLTIDLGGFSATAIGMAPDAFENAALLGRVDSGGVSGPNVRRPTAAQVETFSRIGVTMANSALLLSGRLHLVAVDLRAGTTISSITFASAATAAVTPANQWFGLFSSTGVLLRQTVDDGATAWAANTAKTLALTSTYTVATSGLHYLGIMVNAATVPSLVAASGFIHTHALTPVTNGFSTSGLTTTAPDPAALPTAQANAPYAYVS